jgi:hypothetical protein
VSHRDSLGMTTQKKDSLGMGQEAVVVYFWQCFLETRVNVCILPPSFYSFQECSFFTYSLPAIGLNKKNVLNTTVELPRCFKFTLLNSVLAVYMRFWFLFVEQFSSSQNWQSTLAKVYHTKKEISLGSITGILGVVEWRKWVSEWAHEKKWCSLAFPPKKKAFCAPLLILFLLQIQTVKATAPLVQTFSDLLRSPPSRLNYGEK